jgi:NitT/TauT family transport system substrate-binding protein
VVQADSRLQTAADFRGRKIATPQLGNTQDVACRAWLKAGGLKITQLGGDAQVLPTANPDQLSLFQGKKIDAVWTVEPWVTRLEREAGGRILLEQPESITTVLVSSAKFLREKRELARKFVQAHRELTDWILQNPEEARKMVHDELAAEMKAGVAAETIAGAWKRIFLTTDVKRETLASFVLSARDAGFLKDAPDMNRLVEEP